MADRTPGRRTPIREVVGPEAEFTPQQNSVLDSRSASVVWIQAAFGNTEFAHGFDGGVGIPVVSMGLAGAADAGVMEAGGAVAGEAPTSAVGGHALSRPRGFGGGGHPHPKVGVSE